MTIYDLVPFTLKECQAELVEAGLRLEGWLPFESGHSSEITRLRQAQADSIIFVK